MLVLGKMQTLSQWLLSCYCVKSWCWCGPTCPTIRVRVSVRIWLAWAQLQIILLAHKSPLNATLCYNNSERLKKKKKKIRNRKTFRLLNAGRPEHRLVGIIMEQWGGRERRWDMPEWLSLPCNTEDWTQDEPLLWHKFICVVRCAYAITHHAVLLCGNCFGESQVLAQARRRMAAHYSQTCSLLLSAQSLMDNVTLSIHSRLGPLIILLLFITVQMIRSVGFDMLNAALA